MKTRNSGFTLAEVLVSIVIGVISIAAAFASYNYFNKSYKSVSQKAAINSTAREALSLLTKELRNTGYVDPNYLQETGKSERTVRMDFLSVSSKANNFKGKYGQADALQLWFSISSKESKHIQYYLKKYEGSSKDYYLSKTIQIKENPSFQIIREEIFVPYVEDFQIILKDKEGKILVPVCNQNCGSVEDSQNRGKSVSTKYGELILGIANVDLVHTAEIYLTLRSPKEVYAKAKPTKIINGESPHGSNIDIPADKYHRETFFVSVHTRNLATPQVKIASSGQSIGVGTGYNK